MSKPTPSRVLFPRTLATICMRVFVVFVALVALTSVYSITRTNAPRVQAAAPATLNFQARLLSSTGSLVPDGTYNIEFKLYNASTSTGSSQGSCTGDANCLWTETRTGGNKIQVKNGYLSAYLGDVTGLPSNIWNQQLWLTMNVGGTGAASWDGEMTPRIRLTSVPYAFRATVANSAETLSKNTGSFTGTVDFSTLTADRTFLFPDTSLATTGSPGTICVYNGTASNCPAASGSAYYIQNDTVVQTQTNFNIQARDSTTNGTVAGVFRGAAGGQTVDLVQFQATNGSVLGAVTATGNLQVAGSVDTRAAGTLSLGNSTATAVSIGSSGITTTVNGALTATGATTLSSTLGVTGAATLSSNLSVSGLTTLSGGLMVASGDVAFHRNGTDVTATGTLTDLNLGLGALFRFNGASAQTLSSIANPADGRIVTLINAAATALTIQNDTGGTAANRIITGTGGNISVPAGGTITLIYDSGASRWRIVGEAATSGGGANQQLSNLSGTVAVNQSLTPGNDNTLDLGSTANSWRTLYAETSVLTTTIDAPAAAGTLNIGDANATTLNIGANASGHTINIGTSATGSQTVNVGSSANSSYLSLQAGSNGMAINSGGVVNIDFAGMYTIGPFGGGNNFFSLDSASGDAIFTTYSRLKANGLASYFDQGIEIGSAGSTAYTTPLGATLPTRINIPNYNLNPYGSIMAFGLPSGSDATARGILIADARATAHQATIGVLSPNESDIFGFSWEGSNTTSYMKTLSAAIGLRTNTTDLATFATTGISLLQNTSVTGTLGVSGATTLSSTLGVTGATTLSSSLGVTGATTLSSTLGVTGATTLSSTLGVTGATTLSSTLGVTGLSTLSGGLTVTNGGNVAFQRNTTDITATGTLTDLNIGTGALFRFNGASAQTLSSIANPADGRIITLINAAATALTIQNDTGVTAANRIITGTGGDVSILTGSSMTLAYDSSSSRWRIIGAVAGGGANQQLSNLSGTVAVNLALNPGTDNTLDLGSSANSWRTLYADTSVLTPTVDTATATTLNIGTVTANAVSISRTGVTTTVNGGLTVTQAATFNGGVSVASNLTVTNAGNVAFQRNATDYSSTGTQDNINFGTGALFRITSASALTISGISGGADGRIITLVNASANTVTISNNASGTAANNVTTGTGTSIVIPAGASQTLAYDSSSNVWRVIGATAPTNGYVQLQSATPGTTQTGNINVSGTGIFGTALLSPSLDVASAGSLSLGTTTATSILMGNNNTTTITVGQSTNTNTVNIGNGNLASGTQTINLGTGVSGTGVSTISIGSVNAGSSTTIRGGTGGITLSSNGGSGSTTGTIIQSATNNSTNALRVQNAAGANLLQIDTTNNNINLLGNNAGEPQPWGTATPLSTGAQARDNTAGVYYNGYLYIPGGDNSSAVQTSVAYIKVKADGSLDSTWATTGTSVPTRSYITVAQANGYLYIMGGASNVASTNVNAEVYYAKINADGTVGTFAQTAPLPAARKSGAAVVLNGYMYYIGGDSSATGTPSATTTVYYAKINPDGTLGTANAWSTMSNALPTAGYGKSGVAANGYLYYVRSGSTLIYYIKPSATTGNSTGAWSTESTNQVPGGPSYTSLYVNNGYLYEVAGEQGGSHTTAVYYSALNANGSLSAWSTAAAANQLPSGRSGGSFMQANGFMYYVGGWNGSAAQSTAYYSSTARVKIGGSLDLIGYSGEFLADGRSGGELTAGNTRIVGTLDVNDMANFLNTVSIQRELSVNGWSAFKNTSNSTTAYQFQNASGTSVLNIDTTNSRIGIGTTTPSYDLSFGGDAARSLRVEARSTNAVGNDLTISAGAAGSGASAFTGGTLNLQGGAAAGTGNANGGNVLLTGGAGTGTGVRGLVVVENATFNAATVQSLTGSATITQANIDRYGTILLSSNAAGYTATMGDPTITTAGRIIYVTNTGLFDMTLSVNGGGTGNTITLKPSTTATMVWNGVDWTAAGASSSTDLQAAYNNTATSAGGAELVLNASGGAADGLTIRNNATTPISGGILEVQSSIGTNLFSVNNFGTELAANGGAETAGGTNITFPAGTWTAGPTSATVARTVTAGQYVTGQAGVSVTTTTTAASGVRNNLTANPAVSTTYQVSFTAKLASGTFTDLAVLYSRDGGTNNQTCTNYSTQTLSTSIWTKITCTITTDATTATDPDLIIRQTAGGTARTFYIDNLSFMRNDTTTTPSNVQIGGGINGGQVTLFTLDRSTAPPVANGNDTYLGSMYYDTTTGRIQCYEADGWGACGSAPDNIIVLTPEYTGAVLNGSGVGTLTADFCANSAALTVGSLCASGNSRQFYRWTSPQASQQTYSIYVSYKLPATFKQFASDSTVTLTALTDNTTNGVVTYEMFRSTGSAITRCWDNATQETQVTSTVNTWQTVGINGNETSCSFAGGDNVIFKINVKAQSNANVYVENLNFTYYNN